jgi:HEAT repeat protein
MSKASDLPPCPPEYTPEEWAEYHRDPCGWCIKELRNPDSGVRCNAADILRGLAWDAVAAIPALIEGCRDKDEHVRGYCVHALVDISHAVNRRVPDAAPSLAAAVPVLTAALSDQSAEVRCLAAHALGAIGAASAPAISKLRELLKEPDEELRQAAESALGGIESGRKGSR